MKKLLPSFKRRRHPKPIQVVCGIIWQEGRLFIAKRKFNKPQGGYWEFPGGKIEPYEEPETALIRELKEELGMEVEIKRFIAKHIHNYKSFSIELLAYECSFVSATFQLTDHDEFTFALPQNLISYNLAPADLFFVKLII